MLTLRSDSLLPSLAASPLDSARCAVAPGRAPGAAVEAISAFATRSGRETRVLVGRHSSCVRAKNEYCSQSPGDTPSAKLIYLLVDVSAGSTTANVSVELIPVTKGALLTPVHVRSDTANATSSQVLVPLDGFRDGDAYLVRVLDR